MLMMMMTGRQAPSSWAAITALENIKLFRFKRFLLQGPEPSPPWSWILVSDWSVILISASDWMPTCMHTSDTTSMIQQVPASVSSFYKTLKKLGKSIRTLCARLCCDEFHCLIAHCDTHITYNMDIVQGWVSGESRPQARDMKHGTIERDWYQLGKHETCN